MANKFINLSSLDFDAIKNELNNYLLSQTEFTDVNIKGTNWNFTTSFHAYVMNYMAYMASQSVNESFLDTADQRKNIVSIAKHLTYPVRRATPASITVSVQLTNLSPVVAKYPAFDMDVDNLVLPAYSVFTGSENSSFITVEDYIFNAGNNFTVNVQIFEGTWIEGVSNNDTTGVLLGSGTGNDFQILHLADSTIANNYVNLYVDGSLWENEQNATKIQVGDQKYQISEDWIGEYNFHFGGGDIGSVIPFGNEVRIKYLSTSGSNGNGRSSFRLIGSLFVNGSDLYEVDNTAMTTTTSGKSSGGSDREDKENIRAVAPRFSASQDRGVTDGDYWALLKMHELVEYVSVWGGENANPPQYGVVYATVKPFGGDVLTTDQIDTLTSYINTKIYGGIRVKFLNPVYIVVGLDIDVEFNSSFGTTVYMNSTVGNTVVNFFQKLYNNSLDFRKSNLTTSIDNIEGVLSNDISMTTYVKIYNNVSGIYYFKLGQSITPSSLSLTLETDATKGWYDDGNGNVLDRLTDEIIGKVIYDEGIVSITDYNDIPSIGYEKLYIQLGSNNIKLYNNVMFNYSSSESSISSTGMRVVS